MLIAALVGALPLAACAGSFGERLRARRERETVEDDDPVAEEARDGARNGVQLPPGARLEADLAYGGDAEQRLDAYLPPRAARGAAILVMVHGGAWMIGDKAAGRVVTNKIARWLPRGYVFVSINYRMAGGPDPLAQADDVVRAVAFVQRRAPQWGADPSRLVLMGHSAGAHLVSLVNADASYRDRHGAMPWLGAISLDSAAMDVVALMEARHPRLYDRVFGRDPEQWRRASPLHRISDGMKPMLLACSERRRDSCERSQAFAARARQAGARIEVLPLDLGHGPINSELGQAGTYSERVDGFLRSLGLP